MDRPLGSLLLIGTFLLILISSTIVLHTHWTPNSIEWISSAQTPKSGSERTMLQCIDHRNGFSIAYSKEWYKVRSGCVYFSPKTDIFSDKPSQTYVRISTVNPPTTDLEEIKKSVYNNTRPHLAGLTDPTILRLRSGPDDRIGQYLENGGFMMAYSWNTSYNVVLPFVNLSSFSSEAPLIPTLTPTPAPTLTPTPTPSLSSCIPIDRFVSPEDLQQFTQAQLGNISAELGLPICPYNTTTPTPIPTFPTTQQPLQCIPGGGRIEVPNQSGGSNSTLEIEIPPCNSNADSFPDPTVALPLEMASPTSAFPVLDQVAPFYFVSTSLSSTRGLSNEANANSTARLLAIYTIANAKLYTIEYSSPEDTYQTYLQDVLDMIHSITFFQSPTLTPTPTPTLTPTPTPTLTPTPTPTLTPTPTPTLTPISLSSPDWLFTTYDVF
jgi:hypothetical protein